MHTKRCVVCDEEFQAKRSDAKACRKPSCRKEWARRRQEKSRRARDPLIGSEERKRSQREGLYVARKTIIRDLAERDLLPQDQKLRGADIVEGDRLIYASSKWVKTQRRRRVGESRPPTRQMGPWEDRSVDRRHFRPADKHRKMVDDYVDTIAGLLLLKTTRPRDYERIDGFSMAVDAFERLMGKLPTSGDGSFPGWRHYVQVSKDVRGTADAIWQQVRREMLEEVNGTLDKAIEAGYERAARCYEQVERATEGVDTHWLAFRAEVTTLGRLIRQRHGDESEQVQRFEHEFAPLLK